MASHVKTSSNPGVDTDDFIKHHKSAFPSEHEYTGWLDYRNRPTKGWKRKYFVLANNFLLMASTQHATKLEKVIPLEGSNIKTTTRTSTFGFEITSHKKRYMFKAGSESECDLWTEHIQNASRLKIGDVYHFGELLGHSEHTGTSVYSAVHRTTQDAFAVKVINKKTCNPKMLSNEVQILKRLEHPNVVRLYDLFETKKLLYLVMEKCEGGELFDQIAMLEGGHFSELECTRVMSQIAQAVKYMHSMGIVHRDLKPENILCTKPGSIKEVKVADFGISKIVFDPEQEKKRQKKLKQKLKKEDKKKKKKKHAFTDPTMTTMCGTISYAAPEILMQNPYDKRVDYWSIGVIMFILLCGYPPFGGTTELDIGRNIVNDDLKLDPEDWEHVSENGKALVLGLLQKDPKHRKTVNDILGLAWVEAAKQKISVRARSSFRKTVVSRKMRKMSMGVFEQNSKRMNALYRSRDDSVSGSRSSLFSPGRNRASSSRTDDDIFELRFSFPSPRNSATHLLQLPAETSRSSPCPPPVP